MASERELSMPDVRHDLDHGSSHGALREWRVVGIGLRHI